MAWTSFAANQLRVSGSTVNTVQDYGLDFYWDFYETSLFRRNLATIDTFVEQFVLYSGIKDGIGFPGRIGQFYQSFLWGDIEIDADDISIREKAEEILTRSNFSNKGSVAPLYGSVMGYFALKLVNAGRDLSISVISPKNIVSFNADTEGNLLYWKVNLTSTTIKEFDPPETKTYIEVGYRDESGQYWIRNEDTNKVDGPYPYCPIVLVKHTDDGSDIGRPEIHPHIPLFLEVDGIFSAVHASVYAMKKPVWLLPGVDKPALSDVNTYGTGASAADAIFAKMGADAKPLVANLDIPGSLQVVQEDVIYLRGIYPELRIPSAESRSSGDYSGFAVIVSRAEAESKVRLRRKNYDQALTRLLYNGLALINKTQGFTLKPNAIRIKDRDVFRLTQAEKVELHKAIFDVLTLAKGVGVAPHIYMREFLEWDVELVNQITESNIYQNMLELGAYGVGSPTTGIKTMIPAARGTE